MEDLKEEINFDPALLYYSTPSDRNDGVSKVSGLNVVQETYNSSNRKHICDICGKRFFTQNSLKTHMENHPADKPIKANLEKEDNTDWKNRFVINKGISCVKANCNFTALDSLDYSKHTATCEGIRYTKENSSSYCELCDCYYSSENYFEAHCLLQHPENIPNISLKEDVQMNTKISDPVSLYVSERNFENERNSLISAAPSMYPDSIVTKKKLKSIDMETSTLSISESSSSNLKNGNDSNPVEPSVSEAVEILKTAIAADSQITNELSTEIYSENETEPMATEKVDDNLILFGESTEITSRPTNNVHDELPTEFKSEEISPDIRDHVHEEQVKCNSEEVSAEIRDLENVKEQLPVTNNSPEIELQTTPIHNPADDSCQNIEYNLPKIEPMETGPSEVAEHANDEMNDHGLQVLSEICETLSSENRLLMNSRPKSAELENRDISCDNKPKHLDESMELSIEQAAVTVQGNDVKTVYSRKTEINSVVNDKRVASYTKQGPTPTTSEYHVLLAAAASLGDELLSINESSSSEKLNPTATSKKPKSVKEISHRKSISDSTKSKILKKRGRNEHPAKKVLPNDSINDSDSDDLDSNHEAKLAVLASSNLVPKKSHMKFYQKAGKQLKTTTRNENRSNSRSSLTPGNSKVKRKLESKSPSQVKRKRDSESVESDHFNVKQRSVRQRKKLILPDFEYSLENKEFSDSSTNENDSSVSMGDDEPVRKRGRPRKKRDDMPSSETSDVKKATSSSSSRKSIAAPKKYSKYSNDSDEQSEEFCLNSTINETESDSRFDDSYAADVSVNDSKLVHIVRVKEDPDDDIHSWLNKVDFSETTSFTSWSENPPKKKLGRPRKKRKNMEELKTQPKPFSTKMETIPKVSPACNGESNQVIIKKKKGRPLLKGKSTVIQQSTKTETVAEKNIQIEKNNQTSPAGLSPRKRGRPCKVRVDDKSDSDFVPSREVTDKVKTQVAKTQVAKTPEAVSTSLKNHDKVKVVPHAKSDKSDVSKTQNEVKVKGASSQIVLVKKRGRPRKSIASSGEDVEFSKPLSVGLKSDVPSVKVIENNAIKLPKTSYSSLDHLVSSVSETDLPKPGQSDIPKTADLPKPTNPPKSVDVSKTVDPPKTDDLPKTVDLPETADLPENADLSKAVDPPTSEDSTKTATPPKIVDLSKTYQYDSTSIGVPSKKRGRPLKKKRSLLKKLEMDAFDESVQLSSSAVDSTNENEGSTSAMDVLSDVRQENLTDESNKKPTRPKPTLWKKKNPAESDKVAPEKHVPDETQQLDEALYQADLRNKSKYSKVFKKVPLTAEECKAGDDLVVCGRCQKKMTKRHYYRYHRISHYYLSWLEDEPPIDLNDDFEMNRILQSMVNPEALRKKAIRLSCERCDKVMKSVVGYVSHVRFCQKKDEHELLEKCQLCPRALKPSSIRHHYIKFHGVTKFAPTNDSKLIPVACTETKKNTITSSEDFPPITVRNTLMDYERTVVQKVDILNDDHFWRSLKTSYDLYMCMGLNCRHMTLGKDDLKSHILSCSATFCEFVCLCCPYITKYESEIIYHRKKKCKETSDSEDNAEEKSDPNHDRRTSRRVRKKQCFYGYDDGSASDDSVKVEPNDDPNVDAVVEAAVEVVVEPKKKSKKEDVFEPTDDSVDDSSDSDYNETEENSKNRSKRERADILLNKTVEESGVRNAFLHHPSNRSFDPLSSTVEVRLETFATSPTLMNLPVDINEWETFPISDFLKYLPIQHKSPKVSFDESPFVQLKVFDSDLIKGVPVCNTGGPVWSMAWAPLPAQVTEQYLAVAGLQHMNHVVNVEKSVGFPSIVQIWKYGSLDNISNDIHAPTLAWAIAHNYGAVWDMEWCPSGGFDNSSTPCRLGILALATSSGCCVIYSMPRLDCGGETRSIAANPEPDLVLKVRAEDVQCTRIVWKRNVLPDTIYGGFSDGTIALWNITSTSSILKKGKTLYPYRTFQAHPTGITALDVHWLDNCRFMVTSSSDRILKFWDLDDLSGPMYEHEHPNINVAAAWMHHWVVAAIGADYLNSTEPTSFIFQPRDLAEKKKSILNIKDTFWSVAYSDWNDAVATSSNGGCVTVYAAKHLAALTYKQPVFEKIVTQTLMVPLSEEDKIQSESVEADTGLPPTSDSYDCSSLVQNYGIKFCDRLKNKPSSENLNFGVDKGNFQSVNKICWNQNYNSFNWLALGYDCGFVRVIRVERFDKSRLTKFYKSNENTTITLV